MYIVSADANCMGNNKHHHEMKARWVSLSVATVGVHEFMMMFKNTSKSHMHDNLIIQ